MRALGDPDAFLPGDLGVRLAARALGLGEGRALVARSARWAPFRAYAVQHLWGTGAHAVNRLPRRRPAGPTPCWRAPSARSPPSSDGRARRAAHAAAPSTAPPVLGERDDTALPQLREQLEEYFAGRPARVRRAARAGRDAVPAAVWRALREVPYGKTCTYAELAAAVGRPTAVRAVGAANGRNPVCLVVPCHRVIGADGSLTGYSGGLERKRALLDLESGAAPLAC